jgi:hypothetical protein
MIETLILAAAMCGDTGSGAVMRVWQVDRHLTHLAPLVPGQTPNAWIRLNDIDLEGSSGDFAPFDDDFLAMIDAELVVKKEGTYTFRLTSDDGSQLWIAGRRVINNDGLHGAESVEGAVELNAGDHPMQVKFFERGSDAMLRLEWKAPGASKFVLVSADSMQSAWPDTRTISGGAKEVAPRFVSKHDVGPEPTGPHNMLTDGQQADGWMLLFDGQQASPWWRGYRRDTLHDGWAVEDGMLVRVGGGGDIVSRSEYDDFDLYLDWMVQPGGNSGIFFNGDEKGHAIYDAAPEMQVLDNIGHGDGVSALNSAGANYALHAPPVDSSRPAGQWNRARIRVDGDHVTYWLNGVETADYVLGSDDWKRRVAGSKFIGMPRYGTNSKGLIGLQDHGDRVAFRNIRIKELNPTPES